MTPPWRYGVLKLDLASQSLQPLILPKTPHPDLPEDIELQELAFAIEGIWLLSRDKTGWLKYFLIALAEWPTAEDEEEKEDCRYPFGAKGLCICGNETYTSPDSALLKHLPKG
jgi:hypothetical protein